MMTKTLTCAALLIVGAALAGNWTRAEDKKDASPEEKAATPGEQHKKLAAMAGTWEVTLKMWMDPTKPPEESKATSTSKMIMGGRYLEEKVKGSFGGMEFLGQGLTAYDNVQKKYSYAWIDNFGTAISIATGTYDADKNTYTYLGEESDPVTAKKQKTKMVTHVIDKDSYEMDMFKLMGDKEEKVMHIDAKRKAAK